jgi:hypothetical protein
MGVIVSEKHTSLLQYRINYDHKKNYKTGPNFGFKPEKRFQILFSKIEKIHLDFIFIFEIVERLRIPNRVFQFLNFFVQLGFVLKGATFD